jgi:large subunit ribosomal protein L13
VDTLSYKTISANKQTVSVQWHVIDAENQVVGRLASRIAMILRGKHKPSFTPHVNCGDKVIVVNADKIRFTGKKLTDKQYIHYTGYPGGQRFASPAQLLERKPTEVLYNAVYGMIPATKLRKPQLANLHIYAGPEHPHEAQAPRPVDLQNRKKQA